MKMVKEIVQLALDQLAFDVELDTNNHVDTKIQPPNGGFFDGVLYGVDFGSDNALAVHSADGPVSVGKTTNGHHQFLHVLEVLLNGSPWVSIKAGHVVVESATVGSSGVEPSMVEEVVNSAPNKLYLLDNRATKNYKKDHGLPWDKDGGDAEESSHVVDAEIIYTIAVTKPERLKLWTPQGTRLVRTHRSVCPYDKRGYDGAEVDQWMANLAPFTSLPHHLKHQFGEGKNPKNYNRSKTLPLAMAFDEPGAHTRKGYEQVIGSYAHGYPSFYRRAFTNLMQVTAKELAGVTRISEVTPEIRKEALNKVRKNIRELWHLSVAWQVRAQLIP
jgi:hypothetical protein